ncbi:MAG TPA: hypothetical protein VGE52_04605, partial [Pirellulales bacterium]
MSHSPSENEPSSSGAASSDRRRFLQAMSSAAALGGALAANWNGAAHAQESPDKVTVATADEASVAPGVIDSPPVLQNPTPTGMTIVWAVNGPATGWVE